MNRVPADYNISGLFPRECPRDKKRCYNGNGAWCPDMSAHTGKPGAWGKVTVLCGAAKKRKAKP